MNRHGGWATSFLSGIRSVESVVVPARPIYIRDEMSAFETSFVQWNEKRGKCLDESTDQFEEAMFFLGWPSQLPVLTVIASSFFFRVCFVSLSHNKCNYFEKINPIADASGSTC